MLSIEVLTRIEEAAAGVAAGLASRGDSIRTVEASVDDPQQLARKEKYLSKILEHRGQRHLSSMRAIMVKTIWKFIKCCLARRETPRRARDDHTQESRGTCTLERIKKYAVDGYTPFWMQRGVVDPWYPRNRWRTPTRKEVHDLPETEWLMRIAELVDRIED